MKTLSYFLLHHATVSPPLLQSFSKYDAYVYEEKNTWLTSCLYSLISFSYVDTDVLNQRRCLTFHSEESLLIKSSFE